jgi:hypothetical protein
MSRKDGGSFSSLLFSRRVSRASAPFTQKKIDLYFLPPQTDRALAMAARLLTPPIQPFVPTPPLSVKKINIPRVASPTPLPSPVRPHTPCAHFSAAFRKQTRAVATRRESVFLPLSWIGFALLVRRVSACACKKVLTSMSNLCLSRAPPPLPAPPPPTPNSRYGSLSSCFAQMTRRGGGVCMEW